MVDNQDWTFVWTLIAMLWLAVILILGYKLTAFGSKPNSNSSQPPRHNAMSNFGGLVSHGCKNKNGGTNGIYLTELPFFPVKTLGV